MVADGYKYTEIGVIPVEWDVLKINDIIDKVLDFRGKTPKKIGLEWGNGNIQALSANNVKMGYIDFSRECNYASDELYTKWMNKGDTQKNDIVLTMEAPLGKIALIPDNKKYILSQRVILLKTNIKVNNLYLFQYLSSETFQNILDKNSTGTTAKGIKQKRFLTLNTLIPPLNEQEKIADILSTADDKIDAIAIQIDRAETLKKGLLQKLLSEGIGHSEFKDSELGKIPESWEVGKLEDVLTIRYGKSQKDVEDIDGEYPILGTGGLMGFANSFLYDKPSVLIGRKGTIDKPQYMEKPFWTVDTLFYSELKKGIYPRFIYYIFQTIPWKKYNEASGVPSLSKPNIHNIETVLVPFEEQKQIADILSTADEKLEVLRAKKEKYETLKKGLLQKLLSGEVRV